MPEKAKQYVAYTQLSGYAPGDVVNPAEWSREEWVYMVEHEVVVPKNSPNDPSVLKENEGSVASGMLGEAAQMARESEQTAKQREAARAHAESKGETPDEPVVVADSAKTSEAVKAHAAATGGDKASKEHEPEADAKKEESAPAKAPTPAPVKKPETK